MNWATSSDGVAAAAAALRKKIESPSLANCSTVVP
jgi:hypothetical protein